MVLRQDVQAKFVDVKYREIREAEARHAADFTCLCPRYLKMAGRRHEQRLMEVLMSIAVMCSFSSITRSS